MMNFQQTQPKMMRRTPNGHVEFFNEHTKRYEEASRDQNFDQLVNHQDSHSFQQNHHDSLDNNRPIMLHGTQVLEGKSIIDPNYNIPESSIFHGYPILRSINGNLNFQDNHLSTIPQNPLAYEAYHSHQQKFSGQHPELLLHSPANAASHESQQFYSQPPHSPHYEGHNGASGSYYQN